MKKSLVLISILLIVGFAAFAVVPDSGNCVTLQSTVTEVTNYAFTLGYCEEAPTSYAGFAWLGINQDKLIQIGSNKVSVAGNYYFGVKTARDVNFAADQAGMCLYISSDGWQLAEPEVGLECACNPLSFTISVNPALEDDCCHNIAVQACSSHGEGEATECCDGFCVKYERGCTLADTYLGKIDACWGDMPCLVPGIYHANIMLDYVGA